MIKNIPEKWIYTDDMEMLFLFYQHADDLLSECSQDTYMLPLHNVLTLVLEIDETYALLTRYNMVNDYYSRYIPMIIDELLGAISKDYIFKKIIGERLDSIKTGLIESKEKSSLLKRWIDIIYQTCPMEKYVNFCRNEIIRLVVETKEKEKLFQVMKNYFISLTTTGYSREFLYLANKCFFEQKIERKEQIKSFLKLFNGICKKVEFLILIDTTAIDYVLSLNDNIQLTEHIKKIDMEKERKLLEGKDNEATELFKQYDQLLHEKGVKNISILKLSTSCLDYFDVIKGFHEFVNSQAALVGYFKHGKKFRQIYKTIVKFDNNHFKPVNIKPILLKRPIIKEDRVGTRIVNIIQGKDLSEATQIALSTAIQMHDESCEVKTTKMMIRNFWTSIEALFLEPKSEISKDKIINSALEIIQKTYILKLLRTLHSDLIRTLSVSTLRDMGILDFQKFVLYFASYEESSSEMKLIYSKLNINPLLRNKIFNLRKKLKNGASIHEFLENHKIKIKWQLERIYRSRNISTHMGKELWFAPVVVNHLHNYFDFIINYILCRSENGDYVNSISSLVFECKNDNRIHAELLKKDEKLSAENYVHYLFGPDDRLIEYEFEIA